MAPPFFNHQVSLLRAKGHGGQAGASVRVSVLRIRTPDPPAPDT